MYNYVCMCAHFRSDINLFNQRHLVGYYHSKICKSLITPVHPKQQFHKNYEKNHQKNLPKPERQVEFASAKWRRMRDESVLFCSKTASLSQHCTQRS